MLSRIIEFIAKNNLNKFDVIALRSGIPPQELNDFWTWALGDTYKTMPIKEMPARWNSLHASDMILLSHHSVVESIKRMVLIYLTK